MPGAEDEVAIIESPFKNSVVNPDQSTVLELNIANVDKVLDEVRPYLIADGGNVEVVDVEEKTRNVILKLKGACGSCPSSTVFLFFYSCDRRSHLVIELYYIDNYENGN